MYFHFGVILEQVHKVQMYSLDILSNQLMLESGSALLGEDGDSLMIEYRLEATDRTANNEFYQLEADSILDFSEGNPFSEVDRY